jgi:hypothetical protein
MVDLETPSGDDDARFDNDVKPIAIRTEGG